VRPLKSGAAAVVAGVEAEAPAGTQIAAVAAISKGLRNSARRTKRSPRDGVGHDVILASPARAPAKGRRREAREDAVHTANSQAARAAGVDIVLRSVSDDRAIVFIPSYWPFTSAGGRASAATSAARAPILVRSVALGQLCWGGDLAERSTPWHERRSSPLEGPSLMRFAAHLLSRFVLGPFLISASAAVACGSAAETSPGETSSASGGVQVAGRVELVAPGRAPALIPELPPRLDVPPLPPVCLSNPACKSAPKETPGFDPAWTGDWVNPWVSDEGFPGLLTSYGCTSEQHYYPATYPWWDFPTDDFYPYPSWGVVTWATTFCPPEIVPLLPANDDVGVIQCDNCTGEPPVVDGVVWSAVAWETTLPARYPTIHGSPTPGCGNEACINVCSAADCLQLSATLPTGTTLAQ
jgi:hypothetical protein